MSMKLLFEELRRRIDTISEVHDNEAMRHDLIIYPLLTSPYGLEWDGCEVVPQKNLPLNRELTSSYIWKNAIPKKRRPDIVIVPYGIDQSVAVIEEKKKQSDINKLKMHLPQLGEYQQLESVVWGVLTDGERWILRRNNEIYASFASISELEKSFEEMKRCIGKKYVLQRLIKYGTSDLVFIKPSPTLFVVCEALPKLFPMSLENYLIETPNVATNLVMFQRDELSDQYFNLNINDQDEAKLVYGIYYEINNTAALLDGVVRSTCEITPYPEWFIQDKVSSISKLGKKWSKMYPESNKLFNNIIYDRNNLLDQVMSYLVITDSIMLGGFIEEGIIDAVIAHPLFKKVSSITRSEILAQKRSLRRLKQ